MLSIRVVLLAIVALSALPCHAGPVWQAVIQTTPLAGTQGWIDIQFNPGAVSWQDAVATVSAFSTDGSMLVSGTPQSPQTTTYVTGGPLPGDVVFQNTDAFNDYFQRMTFGTYIQFQIAFSGPLVDSPDNSFFSGTSFSMALYQDDQVSPIGNTPLFQLDLEVDGVEYPSNHDPGYVTVLAPVVPASVPEPGTAAYCSLIAIAAGGARWMGRFSGYQLTK